MDTIHIRNDTTRNCFEGVEILRIRDPRKTLIERREKQTAFNHTSIRPRISQLFPLTSVSM